jgi:Flp pilus assembly protein TadG
MVEFVILSPVLLLMMCATVAFGEFMIQYSTLSDAVRDAARYVAGKALDTTGAQLLSVNDATDWNTLVGQGKNLAVYGNVGGTGTALLPGLTTGQITVTGTAASNNVTVTAAHPYTSPFGARMPNFLGGNIALNFTMNISTIMRAL